MMESLEARTLLAGSPFYAEMYCLGLLDASVAPNPAVAMSRGGRFVYVWQEPDGMWGTTSGICARAHNANGAAATPVIRSVNTYVQEDQAYPSAAMDDEGNFVIVWRSYAQDGDGWGIYGQRYNAVGQPQGGEFLISARTDGQQICPVVAMDHGGNFVVAWQMYDGDDYGIWCRRFNSDGVALSGDIQVNTCASSVQSNPAIAMSHGGSFAITWQSHGPDGSHYGICARRYAADATPLGGEFVVNSYATDEQVSPAIAMDRYGDMVIAWQSFGQDGSGYGIYAQLYDSIGDPRGSEFKVNPYTDSAQTDASVGMDEDGNFIVAWQSDGEDGSGNGIFARRYDADGTTRGRQFCVNSHTLGEQTFPAVAMDGKGNAAVIWKSEFDDGKEYLYGRFCDATPPVAVIASHPAVTSAGGTSYDFTVDYHDNIAVEADTPRNSDVLVRAPDGSTRDAQYIGDPNWNDGTPHTVTYRYTPPGGKWDAKDAGTYTVELKANEISDTSGNWALPATLGTFTVDISPPTAKLDPLAKVKPTKSPFRFSVQYRDDLELNRATIGEGDILITGPNGFRQIAKLSRTVFGSKTLVAAMYEIAPPGKKWSSRANGKYSIWLRPKQVKDATGKTAAKNVRLGFLTVKC